MAKKKSFYQAMVSRANEVAEEHPRSFVVIDAHTLKTLGTGRDLKRLIARIRPRLTKGQVPLVFRKPGENDTFMCSQTFSGSEEGASAPSSVT